MNNSIYVNMTPNPLDLQQLSCSQGDTSSRKFQFTLHNQGEVYDLSNISDPVFTSFPVSAGGTEELLPSSLMNGSVDLGSLTWIYDGTIPRFYSTELNALVKAPANNTIAANAICSMYANTSFEKLHSAEKKNLTMAFGSTGTFNVINTSYSNAVDFKNAMQGVILYFEMIDSTPATSPIVADIRYPDGLREEESFTYRESPTSLDGNAKLKALYGNSLAWNQLCRTLTSGNWAIVGAGSGTLTFADGVATFSTTNNYGRFLYTPNNLVNGHKYLLSVEIKAYANAIINYALGSQTSYSSQGCVCSSGTVTDANWHRYTKIGTFTSGTDDKVLVQNTSGASNLHEIQVRNIMYFDLTQMGLDISSPSEFTSLFPNSYYPYTLGTLLDFKGTGIKTVGKNLLKPRGSLTSNGLTFTVGADGSVTINGTATANTWFAFEVNLPRDTYTISAFNTDINTRVHIAVQNKSGDYPSDVVMGTVNTNATFTDDIYKFLIWVNSGAVVNNFVVKPMISFDLPNDYEPYTESTTSLPTLTYFPTGMKSAGNVRDELTDNKAITRVNQITIDGTLGWFASAGNVNRFGVSTSLTPSSNVLNRQSNYLQVSGWATGSYQFALRDTGAIYVCLDANGTQMTLDEFKAYMNAHPLTINYESATSSEESIMSASLVTTNGEAPLYHNGDVLECECNSDISSEAGFFDAKIGFTDSDGTNYSNKIQLHVERSPQ